MSSSEKFIVLIGFGLAPRYVERLRAGFPQVEFRLSSSKSEMLAMAADADVLFGWPSDAAIAAGKKLRWLHLLGAGADGFDPAPVLARGIAVSNSRGIGAPNIAEHALAMMFSFARALPALARAQRAETWSKGLDLPLFELQGQTLGIVGLGEIGRALAAKAGALGMRVLGARRSGAPTAGVEQVFRIEDLRQLAAASDHLVACLPETGETRGLIDGAVFDAMPAGSYFYNVGRGATVATADLLAALDSGRLAGAGLDVIDVEPLPPGHPLWQRPDVIMTSHTAGNTPRYWERGILLFERNLRHFGAGQELENRVDLERGY